MVVSVLLLLVYNNFFSRYWNCKIDLCFNLILKFVDCYGVVICYVRWYFAVIC